MKDRGQCECLSSQEVTKTIRMGAVSYQLTDGGRKGECVGAASKSFDVCEGEGTVLTRQSLIMSLH